MDETNRGESRQTTTHRDGLTTASRCEVCRREKAGPERHGYEFCYRGHLGDVMPKSAAEDCYEIGYRRVSADMVFWRERYDAMSKLGHQIEAELERAKTVVAAARATHGESCAAGEECTFMRDAAAVLANKAAT